MITRREALLGVMLAPLVKPFVCVQPQKKAAVHRLEWVEESFDISGLPPDTRAMAQRELNEWWSRRMDEVILSYVV